MSKRGRPIIIPNEIHLLDKFKRELNWEDGTKSIWHYDTNITKNGPIYVEIIHPLNTKTNDEQQQNLPITQQKFFSEKTGKYVGYTRAKALKII